MTRGEGWSGERAEERLGEKRGLPVLSAVIDDQAVRSNFILKVSNTAGTVTHLSVSPTHTHTHTHSPPARALCQVFLSLAWVYLNVSREPSASSLTVSSPCQPFLRVP